MTKGIVIHQLVSNYRQILFSYRIKNLRIMYIYESIISDANK